MKIRNLCLFAVILLSCSGLLFAEENVDKKLISLDDAITTAVCNNTLITSVIEGRKAAVQGMKSARADFLPKATAGYSYTRLHRTPSSLGIPVGSKDNFAFNFDIDQPLFTGFALSTTYKMAKLGIDIKDIEKEQAVFDVVKEVKLAYYNILLSKKFYEVADKSVLNLQSHTKDAKAFYDQGLIPYNDLLEAQVALANAVQDKVLAESNVGIGTAMFNTLLRFDVNQSVELIDLDKITTQTLNLNDLIAQGVQNRPEIKLMELQLKNADYLVKLAQSEYYPQAFANLNYSTASTNINTSDDEFGGQNDSAAATVGVSWTFFEWGKTRAEVKKSRYEKSAIAEQYKGIEDLVKLEVKTSYLNLKVAETNINTAKEQLAQAQENYRITNLQFEQQVTTSSKVLDAQLYLTKSESNYYTALYGYMTALAELERAVASKITEPKAELDKESKSQPEPTQPPQPKPDKAQQIKDFFNKSKK